MTNTEIKKIAHAIGANPAIGKEQTYLYHKAYWETPAEEFHNIRRARMDSYILDHYSIEFNEYDLLVGRFSQNFVIDNEKQEFIKTVSHLLEKTGSYQSGSLVASTGHRVIDYEKLLRLGIKGVLEEIYTKMDSLRYDKAEDMEAEAVYKSMIIDL